MTFATFSSRMPHGAKPFYFTAHSRKYKFTPGDMIHVVSSHLDEEIFENPLEFRWDRFQHDTASVEDIILI
jgi:hypothetical protein